MELLFESRLEIRRVTGGIYFVQGKPEVLPEPVLTGDSLVDGQSAYIYGTVLRDGGQYRMWYSATPRDWAIFDCPLVGYAESDDGLVWRKPNLNLVEYGGNKKNNLCNLTLHSPSVFMDPQSPPSHRYRATGCLDARYQFLPQGAEAPVGGGLYTAHSADGLDWHLDSPTCRWNWADVVASIYHPGRGHGMALLKTECYRSGLIRRAFSTAVLDDGRWSEPVPSLIPDDFDDVAARARGLASGDYYGVALMPTGLGTVAFVTQFRHRLPYKTNGPDGGLVGYFGPTDVTLAYQPRAGACWVHSPGRPEFISHDVRPWARNGIYLGSNAVECGTEQRLYFTGSVHCHIPRRPDETNTSVIGLARWPKDRLFGFQAEPSGEMDIELGEIRQPCELHLNFETFGSGSVRVQLLALKPGYFEAEEIGDRRREDAIPMTGNHLDATVRWRNGGVILPMPGRRLVARLFLEWATVYAYEVASVL